MFILFYFISFFVLLMFYLQLDYVYGTETTRTPPPPSPHPLLTCQHVSMTTVTDDRWWTVDGGEWSQCTTANKQRTMARDHLGLEPKVCFFFCFLLNILY